MPPSIDMNRFAQLKATGDLPSPRGVALAIIRMTQSDDVSVAELARVIKGDPAFVGRIIKAANGLVGLQRRSVVSVQEALMVLGMPAVRTMALGFSLLSSYRKGACAGFDYVRFWSSSLVMALSMQTLVQRLRVVAADEAFSVGLLARIGELAMATVYPVEYGRLLLEIQRNPDRRLLDLEQEALAMTHRELGAAMLVDWGLPPVFSEPVRFFEQTERAAFAPESREATMMQCLVLSRAVAEICLAVEADQPALMGMVLKLALRLGYSRDEFVGACSDIGRQWVEWGKLLQIDTVTPPQFSELCPGDGGDTNAAVKAGEGPAPEASVAVEAAPQSPSAALRVLLVDDDASSRDQLRKVLDGEGHRLFEVRPGQQVLEAVVELQPHMMVIDCGVFGAESERLIRALRATRVGRRMYILLLAPNDDDDRLIDAFESGADDFLLKPFRPKVLAARFHAGQRVVRLQQELERDREEVRHFAAELAISNRRLQEVALTDALTGFPNRRYAIDRMHQEWVTATRNRRPLSCMIIDLDGFKLINDTHGHDVGDMVLRQAADALREALRGQDVICRTGGDEFLVICPETGLSSAMICAERLRASVDALLIETGGPALELTVSIGVAMRDGAMADLDALIKQADRGAYLAKRQGRNRVASVQQPEAPA
ncbi:MAG: diguanylate cyclase response regulator [Betaproteobacteria bacterium HGW-Betaproteobacteria-13]|jgi:diguanylate cyclase (GGDEF)-like protein|nr:MAG: diguanylate cyclase response regulator [Betaproteobacteria bacterium HGW-Betaproteobacteria-19]PKO82445.1 MAG: diguanylate cyclase response regulator [Betaproteobacteria bacterium HGW-Betaproteobacteria-13]